MPPVTKDSAFRQRLGTYFLGVAIGCMIAGFLLYGRYQAKQRQAAERAAQQSPVPARSEPRP